MASLGTKRKKYFTHVAHVNNSTFQYKISNSVERNKWCSSNRIMGQKAYACILSCAFSPTKKSLRKSKVKDYLFEKWFLSFFGFFFYHFFLCTICCRLNAKYWLALLIGQNSFWICSLDKNVFKWCLNKQNKNSWKYLASS